MIFRKEATTIKEIQKISNSILNKSNINNTLMNTMMQYYLLGQANIISLLLHGINYKNYKSEDIKECLELCINGNKELKNMTYDCMKDY